MQLLVFAHVPPPVHGQSVMVQTLLDGLPARGLRVRHVDARLSRDHADIGRWRAGKIAALLACCVRAWGQRLRHGPAYFYYVPAPGKRGALYRDLLVMLLCRPFFSGLVLHWHAVGLGEWLTTRATAVERALARLLLGRAALAIVLSPALVADAAVLAPLRTVVVPNALADPRPAPRAETADRSRPARILFLGLCSRAKGLFATLDGFERLERRAPGRFRLTIAGGFETTGEEREFHARIATLPAGSVEFAGFANATAKAAHFASADVFCFPTAYPHEGQPLTVIEALAYDLPVVTTRWRALPEMLPASHAWFVPPDDPDALADALEAAVRARPAGALRRRYLENFLPDHHLDALAKALSSIR